jgi:hypothetical protein
LKVQYNVKDASTNILEVPKNILPAEVANPEFPSFIIANTEFPSFVVGTQIIAAFTSSLPKAETKARTAVTQTLNFIVDAPYEP